MPTSTSSNAKLMSTEISTYLSGRYAPPQVRRHLDNLSGGNVEDIKIVHLRDFLLQEPL